MIAYGPLEALHAYKHRRKLFLHPTRELHAGMNEFQRLNGFRLTTYDDFADNFFARPRTDDMRQMVEDIRNAGE